MNNTTKTYVHVSTGEGDARKDQALPDSRVKKMLENKEEFNQHSTLTYVETEFATIEEFFDFIAPDEVKLDFINRGWTLAQQGVARALVLDDDAEYVNQDQPVDLTAASITPKERRKASPEGKARKSLAALAEENPELLAQLLAEFQASLSASA